MAAKRWSTGVARSPDSAGTRSRYLRAETALPPRCKRGKNTSPALTAVKTSFIDGDMSETNLEEARAEAWLRQQGYTPSRPDWLPPGQKNPDFWAENVNLDPPQFWAEVKSIAPDDFIAVMEKFSGLIETAQIPPDLCGRAMMELHPGAIEQSVRWVLKNFANRSAAYVGKEVTLVFLQQTRKSEKEYHLEIHAERPTLIWARANELPLPLPMGLRDYVRGGTARMCTPDGLEITKQRYEFAQSGREMQCALVVRLNPRDRVINSIGCSSGGSGQTDKRTFSAVKEANSQIKKACSVRDAPGLVILTPQGWWADNDQAIQAALYGQYTVSVDLTGGNSEPGGMYHGLDGAFRPDKNTHISAVVHVRREEPATFFPNPYARHGIADKATVFAGLARGNVEFV